MNVSPERQEAAWEVVQYLLRPENEARIALALGYPPSTLSAAQTPEFQEYMRTHPNMQVWTQQYTSIRNVPLPFPLSLSPLDFQSHGFAASTALLKREVTLEEFISNLETSLQAMIAEHQAEN